MFLTRWESRPAWNGRLDQEMDRVFDPWGSSEPAALPAINVFEDADAYHLEAEVPGLDLADLELTVTGPNLFTLKGEFKTSASDKDTVHRQERVTGSFFRSVKLPTMMANNSAWLPRLKRLAEEKRLILIRFDQDEWRSLNDSRRGVPAGGGGALQAVRRGLRVRPELREPGARLGPRQVAQNFRFSPA